MVRVAKVVINSTIWRHLRISRPLWTSWYTQPTSLNNAAHSIWHMSGRICFLMNSLSRVTLKRTKTCRSACSAIERRPLFHQRSLASLTLLSCHFSQSVRLSCRRWAKKMDVFQIWKLIKRNGKLIKRPNRISEYMKNRSKKKSKSKKKVMTLEPRKKTISKSAHHVYRRKSKWLNDGLNGSFSVLGTEAGEQWAT